MNLKSLIALIVLLSLNLGAYADAPLLETKLSPAIPTLGQKARLFVKWKTGFEKAQDVTPVLRAKLDDVDINAINPFGVTWILDIPQYFQIGTHTVSFELFMENTILANNLRSSIETLEQEILALNETISNEQDPDIRSELEAQRTVKLVQKQAAESQLPTTLTKVKDESFEFNVVSNLNLDGLFKNITKAQNRNILIQNDDSGWNYFDAPDVIRDRTEASFANQFGLHAQAMLDAYFVTNNDSNLVAADKTATKLFNDPVGVKVDARSARCTRGYATDHEFLANAGAVLFPVYFSKGQEHFQTEKDCFAALSILGTTNQNDPAIDNIAQQDIDNVSDADRVAAFTARLIAANRNAGLRAFDWYGRLRVALLYGDTSYAKAIADELAQDASSIVISEDYYLTGLANTISSLLPFVDDEPSFQAIIDDFKVKLFAQQKAEGRFLVTANEGVEAGIVQDQAFILKALLDLGEVERIKQLINYLLSAQLANGAYDWYWEFGGNFEFVEGNSELLSSMSLAYTMNDGAEKFLLHAKEQNFVEQRDYNLPVNIPRVDPIQ